MRWSEQRNAADRSSAPLSQPIAEIAPRIVNRRLKRVRRRGAGFARQSPKKRHRLRIALKKLRYTAEMLAPLCDPDKTASAVTGGQEATGETRRCERSCACRAISWPNWREPRSRRGGGRQGRWSGARLAQAASEIGRTQDRKTVSEVSEEGLVLVEPDPDRPRIYAKIAEPRNGLTPCGVLPLAGSAVPEQNAAILSNSQGAVMPEGILNDLHEDHEEVSGLIEQIDQDRGRQGTRHDLQGNDEQAAGAFACRAERALQEDGKIGKREVPHASPMRARTNIRSSNSSCSRWRAPATRRASSGPRKPPC